MTNENMKMLKVSENRKICEGIHEIKAKGSIEHNPGQFVMLWLPCFGEKPFVPIKVDKEISFIIRQKGDFTKKVCSIKEGELLGIRGPLGKGFTTKGIAKALLVGGGIGVAPLARLAEELNKQKSKLDIIVGARCGEQVMLEKHFAKQGKIFIATDDGSKGEKANAYDLMLRLLEKKRYDMVYVCGPEIMMKKALDYCIKNKINAEFSLERFMKCGIGICGQCAIDKLLVCKDGPVFDAKTLAKSKEFGKIAYNKAGKKVSIEEFYR